MELSPHTMHPHPHRLVLALGIGQILAWGSSFYLLSVIASPMMNTLGWSSSTIFAGLTLAFVIAGLCAPVVGYLIEFCGGRYVLAGSSLLLASGLALLAITQSLVTYYAAWIILGAAMSAGLYDAAFSALGRLYGTNARSMMSELTLYGGFASTICWPITAFLVEQYDWRVACGVYAALHLFVCMPVHAFAMPRQTGSKPTPASAHQSAGAFRWSIFLLVATVLTVAAALASVIAQHAVTLLQEAGYSLAAAVSLGMLIGPSQVASRIGERLLGRLYHPVWTLMASTLLVFAGLTLLWWGLSLAGLALIFYGAGNGIYSIARGSVPLAIFGPEGYAPLMGKIALPSLVAQALAPWGAAAILEASGPATITTILMMAAGLNCILSAVLVRATAR